MKRLTVTSATLIALVIVALGSSNTARADFTFSVPDPEGDTFGGFTRPHDITNVSGSSDGETFVLTVQFAESISPPDSGDADALSGFILFDVDQNIATGYNVDDDIAQFCPERLNMGNDVILQLFFYSNGSAPVVQFPAITPAGSSPVAFTSRSFTAAIPIALLAFADSGEPPPPGGGDDIFDFAVVLGLMNPQGITDCAPGDGGTFDTTTFQAQGAATPTGTAPATATEPPPASPTETPAPTSTPEPAGLPVLGGGGPRGGHTPVRPAAGLGALALVTLAVWRLTQRRAGIA